MVAIDEEGETHVREDKVLSEEIDELKDLLGPPPRLQGQVDVGVVRLHYTTEEHRHNTWGRKEEGVRGGGAMSYQPGNQIFIEQE